MPSLTLSPNKNQKRTSNPMKTSVNLKLLKGLHLLNLRNNQTSVGSKDLQLRTKMMRKRNKTIKIFLLLISSVMKAKVMMNHLNSNRNKRDSIYLEKLRLHRRKNLTIYSI